MGSVEKELPGTSPTSAAAAATAASSISLAVSQQLNNPVVTSFLAGGVAGAVSRTVVSPFERTKILFQVQGPGVHAYEGVVPTLTKMFKEEGWKGFFRGNGVNCIRIVPYSAVQFSAYTLYKNTFTQIYGLENVTSEQFPTVLRLASGALAGITSVVATYPLDIIRTRLSIQTASMLLNAKDKRNIKPPGIWDVGQKIYRTEGGIKALYRGLLPTTYGVAPYVGLNFASYESFREMFTPKNEKDPSAFGKLAAGACSGAVAQTLTYPFDVLRRRFQVVSVDRLGFKYDSVWGAFKNIAKTEGARGLYKGLSANLLKVIPSMASNWLSFEMTRDFLKQFA